MTDTYKILGQEVALSNVEYIESFVALLGGSTTEFNLEIAIDSLDNVYLVGRQEVYGNISVSDFVVAKWNSAGVLQWQRFLGGAGNELSPRIAIDSLDNVYLVGYQGSDDFVVAKWNSSGVLQWQRFLGGAGSERDPQIAIDSLNNVYLAGWQTSAGAGFEDFVVAKWNSDGVLQWQRFLGGSAREFSPKIAIDSLDNIYLVGEQDFDYVVAKWNSDGVLQWQRFLGGSGSEESPQIAIDSLDNVYLVGEQDSAGAGSYDHVVAKWNSDGVLQWQRFLGGSASEKFLGGSTVEISPRIAIDSLDNVYLVGEQSSAGAGSADFVVAKWDSDGVLQWQRFLGGGGSEGEARIAIDSLDNVYLAGRHAVFGTDLDFVLAKLPPEGITGTYTISPNYSPSRTLTFQDGTLTEQTGTLTEETGTLTEQVGTLTEQTGDLISYFQAFLAIDSQDKVVYAVPSGANASLSTIAIINTGTEPATYKLATIPADNVSSQTATVTTPIVYEKLQFNDAKAIIPTKTIEPNTTHEILGGITLSAGDQVRVFSESEDLIVQVYGVEIV